RGDPFACCFGRKIAPNSRLDVTLHFTQRYANTFSMSVSDSFVSSDQCRQRDAFRGGKRCVPASPVLHCFDLLAMFVYVLTRGLVTHQLFARHGMFAFTEPVKLFLAN